MKKFIFIACACVLTLTSSRGFAADSKATIDGRLDAAGRVIKEIQSVPAKAIPDWIVSKATCVAVIPGYKKAAFIVGGSYGQGVVTCRTAHGWTAPAFIQLEGGSWGLQIGGQSTDLILVAVNQKGLQDLLQSKFKIGAGASAAAGPVGRNAQADTNLTLHSELLTYSRSRGVFAGIDLNGTVVHQNADDTRAFYGHDVPFSQILGGHLPTPPAARNFVAAVSQYFRKAQ
jgi:lipid-binding SYLF domain-containing protein